MARNRQITLGIVLALFIGLVMLFTPGDHERPADADQRPGLVSTALMMEHEGEHYTSGAEYVQAVYASQGIEISTDIEADSYVSVGGPAPGDIVDGGNYYAILIDDDTAMGVAAEGGPVQVMGVTTEDVRRVDW